jgi:hypothetical protein
MGGVIFIKNSEGIALPETVGYYFSEIKRNKYFERLEKTKKQLLVKQIVNIIFRPKNRFMMCL